MLINIIIDHTILNLTISKRLSLCRQSVQVLSAILECHGPRVFDPLWNSFKVSKSTQRSRSKLSSDEDDMEVECSLQQYEDFFDFVKSVLQSRDTSEGQHKQKQVCWLLLLCLLFFPATMLIDTVSFFFVLGDWKSPHSTVYCSIF
jgi:hypothetical protein